MDGVINGVWAAQQSALDDCQSGRWKSAQSNMGKWVNVTGQRSANTLYYNGDTPLAVMISARIGERYTGYFCVDSNCVPYGDGDWHNRWPMTMIVPPGSSYRLSGGGVLAWHELQM